jgi:5-formyltetrahydrofolate cyclo-ligase
MDKAQLRRNLRNGLLEMSPETRRHKSLQACLNLASLPQFQDASTVMMYLSLHYELDTAEVIEQAWSLGKTVAVPRMSWEQKTMDPVRIESFQEEFSVSVSGLRNPVSKAVLPLEKIDLVVVPGLGFDRQGNRLGHGGGYYDRFLCQSALKAGRCGFVFDPQVVSSIPREDHDQVMEFLVTDTQTISVVSQA